MVSGNGEENKSFAFWRLGTLSRPARPLCSAACNTPICVERVPHENICAYAAPRMIGRELQTPPPNVACPWVGGLRRRLLKLEWGCVITFARTGVPPVQTLPILNAKLNLLVPYRKRLIPKPLAHNPRPQAPAVSSPRRIFKDSPPRTSHILSFRLV